MVFLALIAGLILVIAGGSWFAAATTVGWILVAVAVTAFLLQVAVRDAERRIEELESELEDMAIAMMLQERLSSSSGETVSADCSATSR